MWDQLVAAMRVKLDVYFRILIRALKEGGILHCRVQRVKAIDLLLLGDEIGLLLSRCLV